VTAAPAAPAGSRSTQTDCLPKELRAVLDDLGTQFGTLTVVSTTELRTDNHAPGGIRAKLHQSCKAVDFRAPGRVDEILAYLRTRPEIGGINSYRNNLIHLDLNENYKTGIAPRRSRLTRRRGGTEAASATESAVPRRVLRRSRSEAEAQGPTTTNSIRRRLVSRSAAARQESEPPSAASPPEAPNPFAPVERPGPER
jgi:hypothetical protein